MSDDPGARAFGWLDVVCRALAVLALLWCTGAAFVVWIRPMRYVAEPGHYVVEKSFVESGGGPLPLLVPVAVAAFSVWGAWMRRTAAFFGAALLFCAFTVVSGFSIGAYYLPAAGMLIVGSVFVTLRLDRT